MPAAQEKKLHEIAMKMAMSGKLKRKKGETKMEAVDAFVYGTMRRQGWKPKREQGKG